MRIAPFEFSQHLRIECPKILYHYTSLIGLKGIIESKSLFATSAAFLNDYREVHHARQMIKEGAETALASATADVAISLKWLVDYLSSDPAPTYVTSFSENGDDLSQWRGYTPSGLGVSIGFRSEILYPLVKQIGASENTFRTVF